MFRHVVTGLPLVGTVPEVVPPQIMIDPLLVRVPALLMPSPPVFDTVI